MAPRQALSSDAERANLTISLPAEMHEALKSAAASDGHPVGAILRTLIQGYLDNRKARMTPDVSRLAAIARQILQDPKSTTPPYIEVLWGWASDALRATRPQPTNSDWKTLADFVSKFSPAAAPTERSHIQPRLRFERTKRAWRREMVAPYKNGAYWLVEQPSGRWAVNFLDREGNLYAVDGVVLADTFEEGELVCKRDAVTRP